MPRRPDPFHAIADPTRRRIIELLGKGEMPVNRISESFEMSRPAVSQHLRVLLDAGVVRERRIGRERHYRLQAAALREVTKWVRHYERFWQDRMTKLGDYLDSHL